MHRLVVVALLSGCDALFAVEFEGPAPVPPPPPEWAAITAGDHHACAIHLDGTLWCWGENGRGEAGQPADVEELPAPAQVGMATYTAVSAGTSHTCAIETDGTAVCWGHNSQRAVGVSANVVIAPPTDVLSDVKAIAAMHQHSCAIRLDDSLWCWGRNFEGQLAIAITNPVSALPPTKAETDLTWTKIAGGLFHTCGVTTDGALYCWGGNGSFVVDVTKPADMKFPAPHAPFPGQMFVDVAAGDQHSCAVRSDGVLLCWGHDGSSQLGEPFVGGTVVTVPTVSPERKWTAVHANRDQTCGVQDDATLWCWGANHERELGLDAGDIVQTPTQVGTQTPASIALGATHLCALDDAGYVACTGGDGLGQRGGGTGGGRVSPTRVEGTWVSVDVDGNSLVADRLRLATTCARQAGGDLSCWGKGQLGQLGNGLRLHAQVPGFTATGTEAAPLAVGNDHACTVATVSAGTKVVCWGANGFGSLGRDTLGAAEPTPMPMFLDGAVELTAGTHTCARTSESRVYCWGTNHNGQTGNAIDMNSTPDIRDHNTGWTRIAAGNRHTCGVNTGNQVLCWGANDRGQRATPEDDGPRVVRPDTRDVAAGGAHTCAISTTGRLLCWGANTEGQLGDGSTVDRAMPVPVATGTWASLALGDRHSCGIQEDATLWCWGANGRGQLGVGDRAERHSPTQVGTEANWAQVAAGADTTCAVTKAGALYCWGGNAVGQIGDGTAWSTTWSAVVPP